MKTDRKRVQRGSVLTYLENIEVGSSFYIDIPAKRIVTYAHIYGYKVTTQQVLTINLKDVKQVSKILKVTILSKP